VKWLLMMVLVGLVINGPAWGYDQDGITAFNTPKCGEYLDVYAKTTLKPNNVYEGPYEAWKVFGWISGYLTAYNENTDNRIKNILGTTTMNDARRWIASWCRDNPSKDVLDALVALFSKQ